jgi:hypothetical protein
MPIQPFVITKDLYVDQGANYYEDILIRDVLNIPVNLAGFTVRATIREFFISTDGVDFDTEIVDAAKGHIRISLTSAATALLADGYYVYDVEIVEPQGGSTPDNVYRVQKGDLYVDAESTR